MDAGDEDIENPNSPVTSKLHHVQSALTAFLDDSVYYGLHKRFEETNAAHHQRRLRELADDNVCHGWLWALNNKHGEIL